MPHVSHASHASHAAAAPRRAMTLIAAFAFAFAWFIIAPVTLSEPLPGFPLLQVSEAVDLLAPLVLFPIYWILFQGARSGAVSTGATITFLVLAACWGVGHGTHLAANSIAHLLRENSPERLAALTHFYDETLGHYMWHTGAFGLSALLAWRALGPRGASAARDDAGAPAADVSALSLVLPAAAHGVTLFLMTIEGATTPIFIPFAIAFVAIVGARALRVPERREWLLRRPLVAFFLASYVIALVLIAGWGIYWRGLPEFSEVGIID
ncbi:MAG: hypothetical protein ACKVU1_15825 [bacterium]